MAYIAFMIAILDLVFVFLLANEIDKHTQQIKSITARLDDLEKRFTSHNHATISQTTSL